MSIFVGPDREETLETLRSPSVASRVPLTLGAHQPQAVIDTMGGMWVLFPLELDAEAARTAAAEAHANGDPWLPSMEWQFLERGRSIASARTAEQLADAIEQIDWIWS